MKGRFSFGYCAITGLGLLALISSFSARAQKAGDNVVLLGYGHINNLDSSQPLHTNLDPSLLTNALGIQSSFDSPGTSADVNNSGTIFFSLAHFFTDHIAFTTAGGIPAHFKLKGNGEIRPTGIAGSLLNVDLGAAQNNPLANVKQWTPAVLVQYYFGRPESLVRPFLGVGASYTFFTAVNLNSSFQDDLNRNFGSALAITSGHFGPTHVTAYASSSFQPIFNAGLTYQFTKHWGIAASVSYALLHTNADIKIKARDETVLADATTRIDIDPLVANVFIAYRLGSLGSLF